MTVIPEHDSYSKLTDSMLFRCSASEKKRWLKRWGKNNLSATIRLLLNAAVAVHAEKDARQFDRE